MIKLAICNELFEGWDLARVCRFVREVGYDGLELAPFTLAPLITDLSPKARDEIQTTIADAGLECVGLHWLLAQTEGFYLTSPDPVIQVRTGDYLLALAQATHDLGGSLMVLGSPKQRNLLPGLTYETAIDHATRTLEHVLPHLDDLNVDLCLEPLGPGETDFLNTCSQTMEWIHRVGHHRFKLHMDVKAQSTEPGQTVPGLITDYARYARHFHAQDTNRLGPGMGLVDFGPIIQALVDSGYDHWVSVEVFDFSPGPEKIAQGEHHLPETRARFGMPGVIELEISGRWVEKSVGRPTLAAIFPKKRV